MAVSKLDKSSGYLYAIQRGKIIVQACVPLSAPGQLSKEQCTVLEPCGNNLLRKLFQKKTLSGTPVFPHLSSEHGHSHERLQLAEATCPLSCPDPLPTESSPAQVFQVVLKGSSGLPLSFGLGNSRSAWVKKTK